MKTDSQIRIPFELNVDKSEQYGSLIRRFQHTLEAEGISMSLRQVKAMDTIELAGTASNGRERVLINEVIREFGADVVKESKAAQILLPFIPEGVLKARSKDEVFYTYFFVEDQGNESDTFNLAIAEHHLNDGVFQLLHTGYVTKIPKIITPETRYEPLTEIYYSGYHNFLEMITDDVLLKEMSREEVKMLRDLARDKPENQEKTREQVQKVVHYLLTTFRAINFLNEQKRNAAAELSSSPALPSDDGRKESEGECKEETATIPPANTSDTVRTVKMGDWYTYRGQRVRKRDGKAYIRRTEQWLVTGHMRHYKSGRTIYIQPYYKGPGREKENKAKTTIKVEERRKSYE